LISSLINQGDLLNAGRFAEQTYQNLKDIKNGMDQEGEEVADGAFNLADVILRQDNGDLIKAEKLARESLRIRTRLHGSHYRTVGISGALLGRILLIQCRYGDETTEQFERSLAILVMNEGLDGPDTAVANTDMGNFHYQLGMTQSEMSIKRAQLLLAKSYAEEGARIIRKLQNPTHPNTVSASLVLSNILRELSTI
jgi:hypothetical protein